MDEIKFYFSTQQVFCRRRRRAMKLQSPQQPISRDINDRPSPIRNST